MLTRREFLIGLGVSAAVAALPIPSSMAGAREQARAAGFDPDEMVCYGPPFFGGDSDPVERECPAWVLFDEEKRSRLP